MKVLGLDTSTMMTTVAVLDGELLLGEFSLNQSMSHSESLVPMIKILLEKLDLKIKEIDLFAVGLGPGSFTGLRIGIATMKTFSQLFNKPLVGVSTLASLAKNIDTDEILLPMIDCRRNRVYIGDYTSNKKGLIELKPDRIEDIDDFIEEYKDKKRLVFIGDAYKTYEEKLDSLDNFRLANPGQNEMRASSIAMLGLEKYKSGQEDSHFSLTPRYLSLSQAEREKREREKND